MSLKLTQGLFRRNFGSKTTRHLKPDNGISKTVGRIAEVPHNHLNAAGPITHKRHFVSRDGGSPKSPKTATLLPKKSIAPRFLMLAGSELGGKVTPVDQDPSAHVYLATPPNEHEEDKDVSALLGVNSFYRASHSFYMMKFKKNETDMNLDEHVEGAKMEFYSRIPYGTVSQVYFHPSVTEHLDKEGIPYASIFLDKKGRPDILQRPSEMVFFIQTPAGFWNIACHTNFFVLSSQKDALFGNLLKNIRVDLVPVVKEPELPKETSESILLPKMSTIAKNKFRKRIKTTLTQRATIGEFGTLNQENNLLPETDDLLD